MVSRKKILRALRNRFCFGVDYLCYARTARPYAKLVAPTPVSQGGLLIVSGRGMNIVWAQLWPMLSLPLRLRGYKAYVLTTRNQRLLNLYFSLMRLTPIYLADYPAHMPLLDTLKAQLAAATTLADFSAIKFKNAPIGQIALSTYSRHVGTGLINFADPEVLNYIRKWAEDICQFMDVAERVFAKYDIRVAFFTEVFMEEYGSFYYAALNANLNVIRFAGTVRDDAFIFQHLTRESDRIHHSSIDKTTWAAVQARTDDVQMEAELMQNFQDRYGTKWHRSKRNHPNTQMMDINEARKLLGVAEGRKVAVVYSHILYDTLFFFGTDLFSDYSQWLVETVRAAVANPHVDWLIKVHPSNLWRGEMNTLLKGKFEEERLLQNEFGTLPPHVRIVAADTRINPLTWFELADYGITVRGTSGLEMAAIGKTVITGGTGRYEGNGFTVDPKTAADYLNTLAHIHELPTPSPEQARLAKRYAHAIFVQKPYTLTSLKPRKRFGCKEVYASDDLIYAPIPLQGNRLPADLETFGEWAVNRQDRDLLTLSTPK